MKNYQLEPDTNGTGAYMTYKIVEAATGHTIKSDVPHPVAKSTLRFLNGGNGFNGWTPEFMLQRLSPSSLPG